MLTGPVTILAWSFVRDDQPLGDTANQVGPRPARRDRRPRGRRHRASSRWTSPRCASCCRCAATDHAAYLDWSVALVPPRRPPASRDDTQIHTHLCYSEFGEIIGAIDGLDADVTSIEAARSKMEILGDIAAAGYPRGIGPGVYDIHSPRVPSARPRSTELLDRGGQGRSPATSCGSTRTAASRPAATRRSPRRWSTSSRRPGRCARRSDAHHAHAPASPCTRAGVRGVVVASGT